MSAVAVSARERQPLVERVFGVDRMAGGAGLDERLALVRPALGRLPPFDRRLLMMTVVSRWQTDAIADAFRVAPRVVRTRTTLALQNVQAFVETTRPETGANAACAQPVTGELAGRYVSGCLVPDERIAFEAHYLGCRACRDALKTVLAVQALLTEAHGHELTLARAAAARRWRRRAVATAAAVLLIFVGLQRQIAPDPPSLAASGRAAANNSTASFHVTSLPALASVVAPAYIRRPEDPVSEPFARAMRRYAIRDYAGAARVLRPLARQEPRHTSVQFYLGVTELMLGREEAAIPPLDKAASYGPPGVSEHAFYLLGQAWLRQGRSQEARRALRACVKLGGAHATAAAALLTKF